MPLVKRKIVTISIPLHNCNQQRDLRGELERTVCDPVTNPPQEVIFLPISYRDLLPHASHISVPISAYHHAIKGLTFRGGAGAVRDARPSLWRAHAMTAERHQPPHDSSLARSCVTNDDGPSPLTAARFLQNLVQTGEEPIPAHERCFCGGAWDFEQQRL